MTARAQTPTRVWVEQIMGTVVSIHAVGAGGDEPAVAQAIADCCAQLREVERVFSTYRDDSDVSKLRRGELSLEEADPRLALVADACQAAERATGGRFSATWQGWFDPTGYVKGWSVEEAARAFLAPLIDRPDIVAVGINAGGDVRVFTDTASDWVWNIAIADPRHHGEVLATLDLRNGAVATSGTAERGLHIVDPATGSTASHTLSATIVADDLTTADVWATAAVVARDLDWVREAPLTAGMIVARDGGIRRFVGGMEVQVVAAA